MTYIVSGVALLFVIATLLLNPYWRVRQGRRGAAVALIAGLLVYFFVGNAGLVFRGIGIRVSAFALALFTAGVTYNVMTSGGFLSAKFLNRGCPRLPP